MRVLISFCVILILVLAAVSVIYADSGRIYGKVYTRYDDVFEGYIIWGKDVIWDDTFDGNKEIYYIKTNYRDDEDYYSKRPKRRSSSSVRTYIKYGYISWIKRVSRKYTVLKLKDGRELEIEGGDAGGKVLLIMDKELGEVKLKWERIEKVEFLNEPPDYAKKNASRNYPLTGSVTTRYDDTFSGFIRWDNDEALSRDILDGEDWGDEYKIPFENIRTLAPEGRNSCDIVLKSGKKLNLRGTNDVNSDNKGIIIIDPYYGKIIVKWKYLKSLKFNDFLDGSGYDKFKPAARLYGEVETERGYKSKGYILWDQDEEYTCDILNGQDEDYTVEIEFSNIKEITKRGRRGSTVILKSGKEVYLTGSNDVSKDNKGIFIQDKTDSEEGDLIPWEDFKKIVFLTK